MVTAHVPLCRSAAPPLPTIARAAGRRMLSFVAGARITMATPPPPPKESQICVRPVATQKELHMALGVRHRVFVTELGIPPAQEFDANDAWPPPPGVTQFLVTVDRQPIATCRLNCIAAPAAKLERMAVDRPARRKGVGRALLRHIETAAPVEAARGPFFCYAVKEQELFYRECGWIVEEGHQVAAEAGIPHIAMLLRRRPRGSPHTNDAMTLSHVMVRTWDISRARRFYSLLGFQDVTRFMTSGVKAVWIQVPCRALTVCNHVETRAATFRGIILTFFNPSLPFTISSPRT